MSESNAALAEKFMQNDPTAFAKLFDRYHSLVFNCCLRILRHQQDAEDATQETFSRLARHIDRWDSRKPIEPWLIAIAGNRCRTHLSRRRAVQSLSNTNEPSSQQAIEHQAAETLREEVTLAVSQLPKNQRIAFQLFHEQSLSYDQIASQLGCPVGTVKTWVHRARANLLQQLCQREVVSPNPSTAEVER